MTLLSHLVCRLCWDELQPNREPYSLVDDEVAPCCRCGVFTKSGIYVRAEEDAFFCLGSGPIHSEEGGAHDR